MKVAFKQINPLKDIRESEGVYLFRIFFMVLILLIPIVLFLKTTGNALLKVALVPFIFWVVKPIIHKYSWKKAKLKDIVGELSFSTSSIILTNDSTEIIIPIKELTNLNLNYNYIQGYGFSYKDIIHNGLAMLIITTSDRKTLEVKFLIETIEQLNDFKLIWKEYYKRGIKINEFMGEYKVRTILFENRLLTYDEIQKLKTELNVDNFW